MKKYKSNPDYSKKQPNPTTAEEAIVQCRKFVYSAASKWTKNHYHLKDDFISEGYCGVLEAWKRFNNSDHQSKGYRFTSYAFLWIRAYMKEYADKQWKYLNNTKEITEFNMDNDSYEINTNLLDTKKKYQKLTLQDQKLVELKTEGYTFEEIAETLDYDNLHKARKAYLQAIQMLED